MFSSIDRITVEIRERFQQLQNPAQKYAFLRPEVILSMDELNLDQAPQEINKEFQLERVRLQAFVAATDPGCKKKKLIGFGCPGLLKYILFESKLDGLPNIVITLRIFLTSAVSNTSDKRSFSKLKLIKNYFRSTTSTLRVTYLAILAIEHDMHINIDNCIKDFAMKKHGKCIFNQ
ncbi:dimer_Tnp_hAT domain-containing protein [Trichonephila clavipes]|nr:dimer_Tnp_hAT domain-containing protein [Trichonephila clavipes]